VSTGHTVVHNQACTNCVNCVLPGHAHSWDCLFCMPWHLQRLRTVALVLIGNPLLTNVSKMLQMLTLKT
jgi:hypothetical protein